MKSLLDFYRRFSDNNECLQYLNDLKYKDGVLCPKCSSINVWTMTGCFRYRCGECRNDFNSLAKTIFNNSRIPLNKWFYMLGEYSFNVRSISSYDLSNKLSVAQRHAWSMQNKLRLSLSQDESIKLKGIIEIDEVYLAKTKTYSRGKNGLSKMKSPILGMLERGGKLIIQPISNRGAKVLSSVICNRIEKGSTIYTDGHEVYNFILNDYIHKSTNHRSKIYVQNEIHTNSIEGVWSLFKSNIRSTHHSINEKYIIGYCNEMAFRYNQRDLDGWQKFSSIFNHCINK